MSSVTPGTVSPVRICYVISAVTTVKAGTEGHLWRLVQSLDRTRFEPRLVVLQHSDWTSQVAGSDVPVHTLGFRSFRRPADWMAISRLAGLMRRDRTQIVELHFMDAHFAGALAARWARVPVVISCRRDLGHQYGRRDLLLARAGNPFVTRFLANSQEVVRTMSHLEKVSAGRFTVIPNGIDLPVFDQQTRETPMAEFTRSVRGRKVVVAAANLRPVKNHLGLLLAAQEVCREVDDVIFVMLGDGRLRKPLEEKTEELGLGDHVLWLGSVSPTACYLKRSDIGCLASNSEGFSNAIIEYMAAGLPVVATRVGGTDEAVVADETGLLVERGDSKGLARSLIELLRQPERRRRMGAKGRAAVERRFTQKNQVDAYESLYLRELGEAR